MHECGRWPELIYSVGQHSHTNYIMRENSVRAGITKQKGVKVQVCVCFCRQILSVDVSAFVFWACKWCFRCEKLFLSLCRAYGVAPCSFAPFALPEQEITLPQLHSDNVAECIYPAAPPAPFGTAAPLSPQQSTRSCIKQGNDVRTSTPRMSSESANA